MPALLGLLISSALSMMAHQGIKKGLLAGGKKLLGDKTLGSLAGKLLGKTATDRIAKSKITQAASNIANASNKGGHSIKSVVTGPGGLGSHALDGILFTGTNLALMGATDAVLPSSINPFNAHMPQDNDSQLAAEMQYRIVNQDGTGTHNAEGLNQMYAANVQAQLEKLLASMPQGQQAYGSQYGGIL